MRNVFIAALLLLAATAMAQAGTLDPSFGNGGIVKTRIGEKDYNYSGLPQAVLVQNDGKLLIVLQLNGRLLLTRHLADGTLDTAFANKGFTNGITFSFPYSAALQPDGKVLLAGASTHTYSGAKQDFKIARLNNDGTLDATFGQSGVVLTDFGYGADVPYAVAVQPDGRIVVAGTAAKDMNTDGVFAIVRYNAKGSLDSTFGTNGKQTTGFDFRVQGKAMTLNSAGKIVVSGTAYLDGSNNAVALVRYDEHGTLDDSFGHEGKVVTTLEQANGNIHGVAVDSHNNILVCGLASTGFYNTTLLLLRYKNDGTPDPTFNGTGLVNALIGIDPYRPTAMVVQKDDKIIVNGPISNVNAIFDFAVSRFNADGSLDKDFNGSGENITKFDGYTSSNVSAMVLQADGRLVAVGYAANYTSYTYSTLGVARYNTKGILDESFGKGGKTTSALQMSMVYNMQFSTLPADKLLVNGWGYLDSSFHPFLAQYNRNGTMDTTFAKKGLLIVKELDNSSLHAVQSDGKILVNGYHKNANGHVVMRLQTDGSPDSTYGTNGVNLIVPWPSVPSGIGMGGLYLQKGNKLITSTSVSVFEPVYSSTNTIARYNTDGTLDATFGNQGKITSANYIYVLYKQNDDKLWVVEYPSSGYSDSIPVKRYTADGILDSSFGQNGSIRVHSYVGSISEQQNGSFVILGNLTDGPLQTPVLYRLTKAGVFDTTFGTGGKAASMAIWMALQDNDKIITGGIQEDLVGNAKIKLSRYTSNGLADTTFGTNGVVLTNVDPKAYNVTHQGRILKNRLYTMGTVTDVETTGFLAAYNLDEQMNLFKCPSNKTVSTDKGKCAAKIYNIDPAGVAATLVQYKFTGATQGKGTGTASGKTFNKGITHVTYRLQSDTTQSCTFAVTVADTEAPIINNLHVNIPSLWPATHLMRNVQVNYDAADNCGITDVKITIASNEPVLTSETGDRSPDWEVVNAHAVQLRAERLQQGSGRVYTLTVTATDAAGNATSKTTTVTVPRNKTDWVKDYLKSQFRVAAYPNPTSYAFYISVISGNTTDKVALRVLNSTGGVVEVRTAKPYQMFQLGSTYRPGTYYLEAIQGDRRATLKLIKQ